MKKFIIILTAICLCSCGEENWFRHSVTFKGEMTEPQLVVFGRLICGSSPFITVYASQFFEDKMQRVSGTDLPDAEVCIRINGEEWQTMECDSLDNFYQLSPYQRLKGNDMVEIRVRHEKYGEATARQIVPRQIEAKVEVLWEDTIPCSIEHLNLLPIRISIADMDVAEGSVICIHSFCSTNTEVYSGVFSQDRTCEGCPMVSSYSNGYYGGYEMGLYVGTSNIGKTWSGYIFYTPNSKIWLEVSLLSKEDYLYQCTMVKAGYRSNRGPNPFEDATRDVTKVIEQSFSTLGSMEGYQIYGNVEGAIGLVSAYSWRNWNVNMLEQ